MAITVQEKYLGRRRATGRFAYAEIIYVVNADAGEDDDAVETAVLAEAPAEWRDLPLEGIGLIEEVEVSELADGTPVDDRTWFVTVRYGTQEDTGGGSPPPEPGYNQVSFRTTGGSQHFTHSIETIKRYHKDGPDYKIDFKNGVNVQPTENGGGIEGYDKFVPTFEWNELWVFTDAEMTVEFISLLYNLTGMVNKLLWRVFGPNDALYMGVEGNRRSDGNWELVFFFAANKTQTWANGLFGIGGGANPIVKRGWDYLWVFSRKEEVAVTGGTEKVLIPVAVQINVERVYEEVDFIDLGIG